MANNLEKQRIVINKYTDIPSDIKNAFYSGYGEVIISIKEGEEGIYAKNVANEVVKLSTSEAFIEQLISIEKERAMSAETAIYSELQQLNDKINGLGVAYHQDLTRTQYDTLIEKGEVTITDKNGIEKTIQYDENVYYMIYEE